MWSGWPTRNLSLVRTRPLNSNSMFWRLLYLFGCLSPGFSYSIIFLFIIRILQPHLHGPIPDMFWGGNKWVPLQEKFEKLTFWFIFLNDFVEPGYGAYIFFLVLHHYSITSAYMQVLTSHWLNNSPQTAWWITMQHNLLPFIISCKQLKVIKLISLCNKLSIYYYLCYVSSQ